MNTHAEVLIIGGGIAGLVAARKLTESGVRVVLLEALNRLGGRIYTQYTAGYPVDLGAEFVHGSPNEIFELAAEAGIPIVPVEGQFKRKISGEWKDAGHLMADVDKLFEQIPTDEPDQSFQHYLDRTGAKEDVRQQALKYVEGFHAANPSLISAYSIARDIKAEEAIHGDHQFRTSSGYEKLVQAVANRIDPKLCNTVMNAAVKEIHWQQGRVTARTASAEYQAPRAIITVPLGVLKNGDVVFSPPLPEKQNAMSFLEMGKVVRVVLCFQEKFWERDKDMKSLSFLFTDDPDFPTWWTLNPLARPVLIGWAAGHYAVALAHASHDEVVQTALRSLARTMNLDVHQLQTQLTGAFFHDWDADPFFRGAYSYAAGGGIDAAHALAAPVMKTLYFAG
ncbi:MAG TPA: NAD(P)/FAD-dependent oxidoreductase, partial [Candidatus Angelobacter sp.]|nr:NAD(P)/FAD-dependent oxidoreductase [Candidatus Angelobacter sp.]